VNRPKFHAGGADPLKQKFANFGKCIIEKYPPIQYKYQIQILKAESSQFSSLKTNG